jgi:very-short-patch-repair endonuclease
VTQSPIEKQFQAACRAAGLEVQAEQMVGRYRADFLIRSHRIIIELDGHATHASADDRTRDLVRQRYLQRLGWTVLRFTGREVHASAEACVGEVQDYLASIELPAPTCAIYVDWLYFQRAAARFEQRLAHQLPAAGLLTRDSFLRCLGDYLELPHSVAVHLFGTASTFSQSAAPLETSRVIAANGRSFIVEEHQADFLAIELLDHLKAHRAVYEDRVILVADDGAYPPEFLDQDPGLAALIRDEASRSRMLTVRAAKWQDIDYIFAPLAGVPLHLA